MRDSRRDWVYSFCARLSIFIFHFRAISGKFAEFVLFGICKTDPLHHHPASRHFVCGRTACDGITQASRTNMRAKKRNFINSILLFAIFLCGLCWYAVALPPLFSVFPPHLFVFSITLFGVSTESCKTFHFNLHSSLTLSYRFEFTGARAALTYLSYFEVNTQNSTVQHWHTHTHQYKEKQNKNF